MNFIQYVKQVWKAKPIGGTPFSPDRLNHMEDGIKNNNSMISELNNNLTNNICTNLLNPTLETSSKNGITCTNNGDGTYTFTGTATAETDFTFSTIKLKYGKYKLLDALGYQRTSNNARVKTLHDGDIFEVDADKPILQIHMHFAQGATANNLNKKPMITTNLNATHDDFVSYTGNTGRLNADVALLKNNLDNNIIGTLDNHSIGSENNINMDSELFSSHKPLYIHAVATQNPSSITGMPQGAYGYGVLITLLSKYESTWGTCQIYIPHAGEVSRDIYVRTLGDTYKRKPSWRRIESTQIEAT
jgi:hypothetical protein